MFDHWDIVSMKIAEILSVDPHNKMALFAKAVYGSEGVLAGVSEHDVKNAMISLRNADPNIFMAADNAIANKEMLWDYEFTHPMTVIPNAQWCVWMRPCPLSASAHSSQAILPIMISRAPHVVS